MIAGNAARYFCASADNPMAATLVCHQTGCTAYPFLCGRSGCSCANMHNKHHLQLIGGFLEELASPPRISDKLTKETKDVDGIIKYLIESLQTLRERHNEYVMQHAQGHRRYVGLVQKLLQGQQLQNREATGDVFAKMLGELEAVSGLQPPYRVNGQQLQGELRQIKSVSDPLLVTIQRLWRLEHSTKKRVEEPLNIPKLQSPINQSKPIYWFSDNLKNQFINIADQGKKATTNEDGLVLLEPCLSPSTVSRTTFKINQLNNGYVGVGICLKDIVAQEEYSHMDIKGHGLYMLSSTSEAWTHNSPNGNGFKFDNGNSVTVEVDPKAGKITYTLGGGQQRYEQPLQRQHLKAGQLHFTVELCGGYMKSDTADVSVIDT